MIVDKGWKYHTSVTRQRWSIATTTLEGETQSNKKRLFILKHRSFESSEEIIGIKGTRSAQTTFILAHYFLRQSVIRT
ncbi:hypothetical protein, partial [uncultured Cocleimonas sp.]|uniref:hypothetical protein n=1 Tax=uncultured Cocleimonas sp. TaxID=1051587 RepID=UPI00260C7947